MPSQAALSDQVRLAANPARLRKPAFRIIDALQEMQHITGGERLLATAVALLAMCETTNVPFYDLVVKAQAMMRDVEGPFTAHLQAVRDYAAHDLRGD